jgi:hypothetical protein
MSQRAFEYSILALTVAILVLFVVGVASSL